MAKHTPQQWPDPVQQQKLGSLSAAAFGREPRRILLTGLN